MAPELVALKPTAPTALTVVPDCAVSLNARREPICALVSLVITLTAKDAPTAAVELAPAEAAAV